MNAEILSCRDYGANHITCLESLLTHALIPKADRSAVAPQGRAERAGACDTPLSARQSQR
jgi:hypothetical protein